MEPVHQMGWRPDTDEGTRGAPEATRKLNPKAATTTRPGVHL